MQLNFKVKSIRMCRPKKRNTLAYTTVSFPLFGEFRFRIAQDDKHDQPTVYPLRHGEGSSKLSNTFKLSNEIMEDVKREVLMEYFKKASKQPSKTEVRIIEFPLRLVYRFYTKEKQNMTTFRIWFICRYLLDERGSGTVLLKDVVKLANLKPEYIKRLCNNSNLFRGVNNQTIYFTGTTKVLKARKQRHDRFGLYRQEKLTKIFLNNFKSNKKFAGYIVKTYAEKDLTKNRKTTHGRISQERLARVFNVSPRTIWDNLKIAKAKRFKNIREYPWIEITYNYNAWLLHNLELRPDSNYPEAIIDNPKAYLPVRKGQKIILARKCPDIFSFTGFFQVLRESKRGKAKSSSLTCNNS